MGALNSLTVSQLCVVVFFFFLNNLHFFSSAYFKDLIMAKIGRRYNHFVEVATSFKHAFDLPRIVCECGDEICRGMSLSEVILSQHY